MKSGMAILRGAFLLKAHFPEFYQVKLMEDNQASITVMGTGNSSTMRYASKTQNICFKWMKQQFEMNSLT